MKVELNIDSSNMGETIADVFKTLTDDQKKQIATSILTQWLTEPRAIEQAAKDKEALAYARKEGYRERDQSDDEIRKSSSYYRSYLERVETVRDKMVKEITSQVIQFHKEEIAKQIQADPEFEKLKIATFAVIKENFPKMVSDAMMGFFLTHMNNVTQNMFEALNQSNRAVSIADQVRHRLLPNG